MGDIDSGLAVGDSRVRQDPASGVLPGMVAQILEYLPVAVLVVDASQRIRELNLEAGRLLGYSRGELLGASLERLLPAQVRQAHAGWVREFCAAPGPRAMGA